MRVPVARYTGGGRYGIWRAHCRRQVAAAAVFARLSLLIVFGLSAAVQAEPSADRGQERLVRNHVDFLRGSREGVSDIYFVGIAPYSTEDVFMNEATYVRNLFDAQYDTHGRSILLVNNRKTLELYPAATLKNIERVFSRIGSLIDPEEDIVVLYITSHGEKNEGITVKFENIPHLKPDIGYLDPETIARLLGEHRIKWRILLLLACFSGEFLERLKDEHTLIITSAARDKSSFGCGHHGDFTQFGEAFFGRELGRSRDLISSFHRAKARVERLERKQNLPASEPQIFVGEKIRPLLDQVMF